MNKLGRNDPCPCGSGKKYKQCCLKSNERSHVDDRSKAVPKAIDWLMTKHDAAVREALDTGFFGYLDNGELNKLFNEIPDKLNKCIMINAMEWLLSDGSMIIKGRKKRVSEWLFEKGGPLFSVEQKQWIELLASKPLRLYEVVDVHPGESMTLKDVLLSECQPCLVLEKSASQELAQFDLIAARMLPVGDYFLLSGAIYHFSRQQSWDLIEELRDELGTLDPESPLAKEITGDIIPDYWMELLLNKPEIPQIIDQLTKEPILFIHDRYRVLDWNSFERKLSAEQDVDGNRDKGWVRVFEIKDSQIRTSLTIDLGKRDTIKVSYRTQKYADEGKTWLEAIVGDAVKFISRDISDPKGMLTNVQANDLKKAPEAPSLPPEIMTAIIKKKVEELYANWADQPLPTLNDRTPRETIQTPEGLEQVQFLLHSYEHSEAEQAKQQHREPISYDFLWQSLGIMP